MKFEEVKFNGKDKVKYTVIHEIMDVLDHTLSRDGLSYLALVRYIEVLVDDQHYNPKTGVFYDKVTNRKLNLEFLAGVAHDYIVENIDEFRKYV